MSTDILGISCYYHDSAAALVRDGEIIAAAQEERFTRRKHDPGFPDNAINYCLEEGEIDPEELAAVVFYDNPLLTFDRIVKSLLHASPKGVDQWLKAAPTWLGLKLRVQQTIHERLDPDVKVLYSDHHMSHAASAFYPSPYQEAAVITMDGVGEWATTTVGVGRGEKLEIFDEIAFPHSLGLLYSAFTYYTGFRVNSGEYKLMGLAAYGEPKYESLIRECLIDIKDDGSYRLNMDYFGFLDSNLMINQKFENLFGGPAREPESRITRRDMNLASSIQVVLEDVVLKLARRARNETGLTQLAMAGGVALNCVANGKILSEGIFDEVWIQPAAGDAGGALGAALVASHTYFGAPRRANGDGCDGQKGSYLGPAYSNREVKAFLDYRDYPYVELSDDKRSATVASAIADGKIVGYMVGRMEYGPRSLGARSILGDARSADTQSIMNQKIKFRESFRPFAPSVLAERSKAYFDLKTDSPYMLLVAPVNEERRLNSDTELPDDDNMLPIINRKRSDIPAVTHVDYSARIQTVSCDEKPDYYALIKEFENLTGYGLIVNTSFNVRGEPIVASPEDAYRCFMRTGIDMLVLENCILQKTEQPVFADDEDWRETYAVD
ncbi:MAG: carbamoyltransferase [SAR202 cluster bacterium]|nr:carbamoyltransferase [SAR202 cluster bacterium]